VTLCFCVSVISFVGRDGSKTDHRGTETQKHREAALEPDVCRSCAGYDVGDGVGW